MIDDELYLIQDSRGYVGNDVLWWRANKAGYTTSFDEAGRYSKEEAESIAKSRSSDVPWKVSEILPLVGPRKVDMQWLPKKRNPKKPRR